MTTTAQAVGWRRPPVENPALNRVRLQSVASDPRLVFSRREEAGDKKDEGDGARLPPAPGLDYPTLTIIAPQLGAITGLIDDLLGARQSDRSAKMRVALARRRGEAGYIDRLACLPDDVLRGIRDRLAEIIRKDRALALVATYLPGRLKEYQPSHGWAGILIDFLKCIRDAGWIPLDEDYLEYACDMYNEENEDDALKSCLDYIPVERLCVDESLVYDSYSSDYAEARHLLFALLVDKSLFESDSGKVFLKRWGLDVAEINPAKIVRAIRQAPPGTFNPGTPLAYLPEVLAIHEQKTGFDLVDKPESADYEESATIGTFEWRELNKLRYEWVTRVRELIAHWCDLELWLGDDDNARGMVALLTRLSEGEGV